MTQVALYESPPRSMGYLPSNQVMGGYHTET